MNCPRCHVTLQEKRVAKQHQQLSVDQCPQCEGLWIGAAAMAKLETIVEPVVWEVRQIPEGIDQLAALYCPSCETHPLLVKADHDRDRNVVVDYCESCSGWWLDKGELRAIQQEQYLVSIFHLFRDLH